MSSIGAKNASELASTNECYKKCPFTRQHLPLAGNKSEFP